MDIPIGLKNINGDGDGENTTSLLEALQKLKDSGVLSDEEFHDKVQEIRHRYRIKVPTHRPSVERRKTRRNQVRYFLSILDQITQDQLGLLVDITTEGAMLIREDPMDVDKVYNLRIILPEPIDGCDFIDIEGVSTWSEKDINPSFYATGFRFNRASNQNRHLILRLMNTFGGMSLNQALI